MSIRDIVLTNRTSKLPVTARPTSIRARGRIRKRSGQMNKTESAFHAYLRNQLVLGRVLWFAFEAIKLRLADNTHLTPDFAVLYADGHLALIDTKGTKRAGKQYKPWIEEDAQIKLKIAAETFPITVAVAYKVGSEWRIEEV